MAKKNKNDRIPTPSEYVEEMLDRIDYKKNIVGKLVLENSCGQGNVLVSIVNRYIIEAKTLGLTNDNIAKGLERDILAFETDVEQIEVCITRLNKICNEKGIPRVDWNIHNEDFLKYPLDKINASYVIGNPPYITYHDLDEEERIFLKQHFEVCKNGRFDYCYAFIEASIRALKADGQMIYLIPFSIFRNRYGKDLRRYIRKGTIGVVDYTGRKVFPGITCSSAFLYLKKGNNKDKILYENNVEKTRKYIKREDIGENGEKWIFNFTDTGTNKFGDYYDVHNSVATLLNEAFLISPEDESEEYFIQGQYKIEKSICLPAISTKSGKKDEKQYIIFPYKRECEGVGRYPEKEFQKLYPGAHSFMKQFAEKLENRKSDKNAEWFEYGRSQALNEIWKQKLIVAMVITKQVRIYLADEYTVPYAGYFVTQKKSSQYTLKKAAEILQSKEFYQYVREVGTPTTENSYRISVNDIKKYKFE